ncbi:hypothetical protein [Halorussus ruber]|uniref:hypothetical protein n=1 Tax=Halorussus ruber TaxID=1126238 RepID=UPI001091A8CE|nr:hypothetical protein [Halorussus ruber]
MTDLDTTDSEIARRLTYIHQTLELIALLLAVVALGQGTVGFVAGGAAILLLVGNVVSRALEG